MTSDRPLQRRLAAAAACTAGLILYVVAFVLLEPSRGMDTAAFMLVPVGLAAWWFGFGGGLAAAVALLFVHAGLSAALLHQVAPLPAMVAGGLPTTLVTLAFGAAVAAFRRSEGRLVRALVRSRELEARLSASAGRLREIGDNVLVGTYSVRDGRFAYVNRAFATTFGFAGPAEVMGRVRPEELVHPDDWPAVRRRIDSARPGAGPDRPYRFRGVRRDGSLVPVEVLEHAVALEGGRAVIGTLIDRSREERDEAELRLRLSALEAAPVGIIVTDPDAHIEWANPYAAELTGYHRQELLGQHTRLFNSGHQDGEFYAALWGAIKAGRPWAGELVNRRKDGSEYLEAMSITPVVDATGSVEHFVAAKVDVTEQTRARERIEALNVELTTQLRRLETLRELDAAIVAGRSFRASAAAFVASVRTGLGVDAAAMLAVEEGGETLELVAAAGFRAPATGAPTPLDAAALQPEEGGGPYLLEGAEAVARALDRVGLPTAARDGLVMLAVAPMHWRGGLRGSLVVGRRTPLDTEPGWLDHLTTVATQGAILIDNATLVSDLAASNRELRSAYDATIEGWSRALDLRDKETEGHSRRVTDLTLRLAEAMGLSGERLVHVRRGALLHDIGKMGVPDAILQKPGLLTDEEWTQMRRHTVFARDLLAPIRFLRPALDIPYSHHERWDGSGYPEGLRGEAIPLAARIFAIADVYDALTSDRPYRPAWNHARAVDHIRQGAGRHFDPEVVAAFLALEGELRPAAGSAAAEPPAPRQGAARHEADGVRAPRSRRPAPGAGREASADD